MALPVWLRQVDVCDIFVLGFLRLSEWLYKSLFLFGASFQVHCLFAYSFALQLCNLGWRQGLFQSYGLLIPSHVGVSWLIYATACYQVFILYTRLEICDWRSSSSLGTCHTSFWGSLWMLMMRMRFVLEVTCMVQFRLEPFTLYLLRKFFHCIFSSGLFSTWLLCRFR